MKKFMQTSLLTLALSVATLVDAKGYDTNPVVINPPSATASVVPDTASGLWYSPQVAGLRVVLSAGDYTANLYGLSNCGKVLNAQVSIPRTAPKSGTFYAFGQTTDAYGVGIPFGEQLYLFSNGNAGTFSVVSYNTNSMVVNLVTPAGGPNGNYTLVRDPLVGVTAVVSNCQ